MTDDARPIHLPHSQRQKFSGPDPYESPATNCGRPLVVDGRPARYRVSEDPSRVTCKRCLSRLVNPPAPTTSED